MTHHLYRHFDDDGVLLYVGQSCCAVCRLSSHRNSEWFKSIALVTIERHANRSAALAAEHKAIETERPKFNKLRLHEIRLTEAERQHNQALQNGTAPTSASVAMAAIRAL